MYLKAKDLSGDQLDDFVNSFYDEWEFGDNDIDGDNPNPWGCPWIYNPEYVLSGETIEEMAQNYYQAVREDIGGSL